MIANRSIAVVSLALGLSTGCSSSVESDVDSATNHFTETPGDPDGAKLPKVLEQRVLRVDTTIDIPANETIVDVSRASRCTLVLSIGTVVDRRIMNGNRYRIRKADTWTNLLSDGSNRNSGTVVWLGLAYEGTTARPDPFADRVGQDADFDIRCDFVHPRDTTITVGAITKEMKGAFVLERAGDQAGANK